MSNIKTVRDYQLVFSSFRVDVNLSFVFMTKTSQINVANYSQTSIIPWIRMPFIVRYRMVRFLVAVWHSLLPIFVPASNLLIGKFGIYEHSPLWFAIPLDKTYYCQMTMHFIGWSN